MKDAAKKIVICATHRSGSTMVCDDLTGSGVLGRANEHFVNWARHDVSEDYGERLAGILKRGTTPNGIFAVKVMADQVRMVDARLRGIVAADSGAGAFPHFIGWCHDATWVYVVRRDSVRQAISNLAARKTGIFHRIRTRAGFVPGRARRFPRALGSDLPYADLLAEIDQVTRANLFWRSFFERNRIEPIELVYEEIAVADRRDYLRRIAASCGIAELPALPERNLQKLSGPENDSIYRNFMDTLLKTYGERRR